MKSYSKSFITMLYVLSTFALTFGVDYPAALSITNVDTDAGTLDITMTNQPGCKLLSTGGQFDASYTDSTTCADAGVGGNIWFDGRIGGVQFELTGVTVTGASGGIAADTGEDGWNASTSATTVLLFTIEGDYIPAGEGVLTTVTFSDYTDGNLCFGQDTGQSGATVISDANGDYVVTNWGACWCGSEDGDQYLDCDGECAGTAVEDCNGLCNGTAELDALGVCEGTCENDSDGDGVCDALDISQINSSIPDEFSISQNFPNPFNPVTSITFDVPEVDDISITVYDLTGKEIINLVSGVYTPGSYIVDWDAFGVSSGMYIYRYTNGRDVISRKMLYLK